MSKNQVVWPRCHLGGLASAIPWSIRSSGSRGAISASLRRRTASRVSSSTGPAKHLRTLGGVGNHRYHQPIDAAESLERFRHGEATAEWAKGVVANMARDPKGNDRAQIMAVAAGEADIAVANTYYLALMLSGNKGAEQQAAAKKVKAFFPNQQGRGTHMNISCAALVKGAPNKVNAIALVDYLLSPEAQEHFTNNTFEFPMIAGVSPSPLVVNNLGLDFKQDLKTKVSTYGKNQAAALEVMTAAGWK